MLTNYSSAASTMAETAALVSNDLRSFLTSDASELPQSLRQLNKLLQAPELQETVSAVTASVVRGAATATGVASLASSSAPGAGPAALLDTVIEAVLSERGRGLIGMAVGIATRNATVAVCEFVERRMEADAGAAGGRGFGPKDLLDLLASEQGERVLTLLLTNSIRTAVTSYVDATTGYNMYDDVLSSIAKTEHRDALTDLMSRVTATFCKEIVLAYRRSAAASAASAATAAGPAPRNAQGSRDGSSSSGGGAAAGSAAVSLTVAAGSVSHVEPVASGSGSGGGTAAAAPSVATDGAAVVLSSAQPQHPKSSNVQQLVLSGQNGRLSGLHMHQHHKLSHGGANAAAASGALGRAMLGQAPPPWLRQVVDLVRERDVRALAVDVVTAASREATRGAVEGFMQGTAGAGGSACGVAGGGLLVLPSPGQLGAKLCVLASLALALAMYALSPRTQLI